MDRRPVKILAGEGLESESRADRGAHGGRRTVCGGTLWTLMKEEMTQILLVGSDLPLLEGLAQSLAAAGHSPRVAASLAEARDTAAASPPLIAVVSRTLGADAPGELLAIPLAPGGAVVLYHTLGSIVVGLPVNVQRVVLADLTLPLERNRLLALVQHVQERARATGRVRGWDDENPSVNP